MSWETDRIDKEIEHCESMIKHWDDVKKWGMTTSIRQGAFDKYETYQKILLRLRIMRTDFRVHHFKDLHPESKDREYISTEELNKMEENK